MPHLVRRLLVFIAPVFLYVFIFKIALSGHNPYIYQDTDELAARYIVNVLGNATEKGNNSLTSATKSKVVDHAASQRLTNVSQAEHHVESKNKSVASKNSAKPTVTTTTKTPASKRKPKRRKPRTRFSQLVYSNLSCPFDPPNLVGPIVVNKTSTDLAVLEQTLPRRLPVSLGGTSSPSACLARHRVAIIVPYRNRPEHLPIMLRHLHPMLIRQQLSYRIFVVEQTPKGDFNKALLFNAGVREVEKRFPGFFTCIVLQDVDILPENDQIYYGCSETPRHFSLLIDRYNYTTVYTLMTGGAFEIDIEIYKWINGFSNLYFKWGGEDDDFAYRMLHTGIRWHRFPKWSRFAALSHKHAEKNRNRIKILRSGKTRQRKDGYNSAVYKVNDYTEHPLYTNISTELTIFNADDYVKYLNITLNEKEKT